MIPEYRYSPETRGWIEVICGSMFSGKTEELIRRLKRSQFAKQHIATFKPDIDKRYDDFKVVSHQGTELLSQAIGSSKDLLSSCGEAKVLGIDEAQFFDMELPQVAQVLANKGLRVIIAGLDLDYKGEPFGPMPQLMAIAEYVTKVHAICMRCGSLAYVSHRKFEHKDLVMLGETEAYEPLCRTCFNLEKKH
jgi:thymidine kinase